MKKRVERIKNKVTSLQQVVDKYNDYEDLIGRNIKRLTEYINDFSEDAYDLVEENRKLRIGVVGQMKAGKSSFLNALFFDGQDLLPKAATPMTAALTVISYGKTPKAEINFYSEEEWMQIKEDAAEYDQILGETKEMIKEERKEFEPEGGIIRDKEVENRAQIPEEIESARELVRMAQESKIQVRKHLGTTKNISATSLEDLIGKLEKYVGSSGEFTSLVKSSKLYLNIPSLKNIEVVDTPGINDPIISRGRETRKYLGKCDVIFLLSYAGQFMDGQDIGLLFNNISKKGIKDIVILGSKFDSVLMDEGLKYRDRGLKVAKDEVAAKLREHAQRTLQDKINNEPESPIYEAIKNSPRPYFISALVYNIALKDKPLTEEEKLILKNLKRLFSRENFSEEELIDLSNIPKIKDEILEEVKNRKEEILSNRFSNLLDSSTTALRKELQKLLEEINNDYEQVKSKEINELKENYESIKNKVKSGEKEIKEVFSEPMNNINSQLQNFKFAVRDIAASKEKIEVEKGSEEVEYTKEKTVKKDGMWNGVKRLFGATSGYKTKTITKTRTEDYSYAEVQDSIDNLETFIERTEETFSNELKRLIDIESLRAKLIEKIKNLFDYRDEKIDAKELILIVRRTVNRITLPDEINLNTEKYINQVTKKFGAKEVRDSKIDRLREVHSEMVENIINDTFQQVDRINKQIKEKLESLSNEFTQQLLKDFEERLERLTDQLNKKEKTLKKYEKLIKMIKRDMNNEKFIG